MSNLPDYVFYNVYLYRATLLIVLLTNEFILAFSIHGGILSNYVRSLYFFILLLFFLFNYLLVLVNVKRIRSYELLNILGTISVKNYLKKIKNGIEC